MRLKVFRISRAALDLSVLTIAFVLAFAIRFDLVPPTEMVGRLLLTAPYIVVGEYIILWWFGVPRCSWRFVGLRDVVRIGSAVLTATLVLLGVRLALGQLDDYFAFLRHGVVPIGALGMNAAFMFLGVVGVRVLRRGIGEHLEKGRVHPATQSVPAVLIGAGQGGVLVAREIASRPDVTLRPVGFVDDDHNKVGTFVNGLPVLGGVDQLEDICARHEVKQVVVAIANPGGAFLRRVTVAAERAGAQVQIVPGLYEIVDGRVNLSRIRPVAIEDLLRREPVVLDTESIARELAGRVVLVTGAGGSIGSEISRQVAGFSPARLVLVDQAENGLFHIHGELTRTHPSIELVPVIADITDARRVRETFAAHQPSTVFHAAAHKHVPLMEWNPGESVKNNVFGTQTVADAAAEHRVGTFVLISTDKAVNPSSVMGATKRVAEMYVQARARSTQTRFVTVRFGNVLGSAGSVVPTFKEQIARGGPVTVTHPEMRRYFMTIPEACQLVLQAGTMGAGGEIFVLDMGEPVKIVDLARDLITLSGLRPGEDIEIEFSGTRVGEKLFEELSVDAEHATKTRHPKIFVGRALDAELDHVRSCLGSLRAAIESEEAARVRAALRGCVPEYRPPSERPPVNTASAVRRAGAMDGDELAVASAK